MSRKDEECFAAPVVLKGFITSIRDSSDVSGFRIISKVSETSHFVILKYGKSSIEANRTFNKLNYKYNLGETWFLQMLDDFIYSISFRIYKWEAYKKMLFSQGINVDFRSACVKNRFAFLDVRSGECRFMFKAFESKFTNDMYKAMKGNLCQVLFGVDSVEKIHK